tara:strand:+ start:184 stop:417 length:234 start_codon:yes stop_codon:yes gene_type:complete
MPYGNPKAYKSDYIMGQMKKQGEMSEVGEKLYREKLDPKVMGENSGAFKQSEDSKSASGSVHMKQAGYIMGQTKKEK